MYAKNIKRPPHKVNGNTDYAFANSLSRRLENKSIGSPSQAKKLPAVQAIFNNSSFQTEESKKSSGKTLQSQFENTLLKSETNVPVQNKKDSNPITQANKDVAQRVKIRLGEGDNLLNELRSYTVPEEGDQTLGDPQNIGDLIEIGVNENIVFEGHGESTNLIIYETKVNSQGGFTPDKIAAFAHQVPKPDNWAGGIVLLGCSTGDITEKVSKEYYNLTGNTVSVTGPEKDIHVGRDSDTGNFIIGPEWRDDDNNAPEDLEYRKALKDNLSGFSNYWQDLNNVVVNLVEFLTGQGQLNTNFTRIKTAIDECIDVDTRYNKDVTLFNEPESKLYCVSERKELYWSLKFYCNYVEEYIGECNDLIKGSELRVLSRIKTMSDWVNEHGAKINTETIKLTQKMIGLTINPIKPFDTGFITKRMLLKRKGYIDYLSTWENQLDNKVFFI